MEPYDSPVEAPAGRRILPLFVAGGTLLYALGFGGVCVVPSVLTFFVVDVTSFDIAAMVVCQTAYLAGVIPAGLGLFRHSWAWSTTLLWAFWVVVVEVGANALATGLKPGFEIWMAGVTIVLYATWPACVIALSFFWRSDADSVEDGP